MTVDTRGFELPHSMLLNSLPAISSRKLIMPPKILTLGATRVRRETKFPAPHVCLKLLLLGDDLILDFCVGGCGDDLLASQVGLLRVGAAINDLLRILFPDAGKSIQLLLGRRVD